jgi:hypothetical protein
LFPAAIAIYGPAIALTALIDINHGSRFWCYAAIGLATFLLLAVVAARPPALRAGKAPVRIRLTTAIARAAPAGAVFASTCLVVAGSVPILRFWDFAVAIPGVYLMFMWMLAVPVAVIEDLPAVAGLRRSWRLIHGHGSAIVVTIAKAYGVWILFMLVPIFVIGFPGIPVVLHLVIPAAVAGLGYAPFAAVALTLAYYRLAAAHNAAVPGVQPGLDAGPEPAPVA